MARLKPAERAIFTIQECLLQPGQSRLNKPHPGKTNRKNATKKRPAHVRNSRPRPTNASRLA